MFPNPLEGQGGQGAVCTARTTSFPKKAHSVHYVPTTSGRTQVALLVQERVACPSWGGPPQRPKTWVMEVVEMTKVKKAGLIALVQGTIKVVLIIAGRIACRTRCFPSILEKGV